MGKRKKHKKKDESRAIIIGSSNKDSNISSIEVLSRIHHMNLISSAAEKNKPKEPINGDLFLTDSNIEELIKAGKENTEKEINRIKNSETKK